MGDDKRIELLEQQLETQKVEKQSYDQAQSAISELIELQVKSLPDGVQKVINNLPLDPIQKANWMKESMPELQRQLSPAPDLKGSRDSTGAGAVNKLTDKDREAMKRASRVGTPFKDEKDYLEAKKLAAERYGEAQSD